MEIGCIHLNYVATANGLPPIFKLTSNSKVGELALQYKTSQPLG
jgi:hypothetical protein